MLQPKDKDRWNRHKNKTHLYAIYKRHTSNLEAQSGSEGLEKDIHVNGDQKIMGVAILISDKIEFKTKNTIRDKERHYIVIKGSIQEDIKIINIFAPKIGAPQYIRQLLTTIKGNMDMSLSKLWELMMGRET